MRKAEDFIESVKARIDRLNLRHQDLADLLGVSRSYVSRILKGEVNLTVDTMNRIAAVLDCELFIALKEL